MEQIGYTSKIEQEYAAAGKCVVTIKRLCYFVGVHFFYRRATLASKPTKKPVKSGAVILIATRRS